MFNETVNIFASNDACYAMPGRNMVCAHAYVAVSPFEGNGKDFYPFFCDKSSGVGRGDPFLWVIPYNWFIVPLSSPILENKLYHLIGTSNEMKLELAGNMWFLLFGVILVIYLWTRKATY